MITSILEYIKKDLSKNKYRDIVQPRQDVSWIEGEKKNRRSEDQSQFNRSEKRLFEHQLKE